MQQPAKIRGAGGGLPALLLAFVLLGPAHPGFAAETNALPASGIPAQPATNGPIESLSAKPVTTAVDPDQQLRASLKLQEQLHATLLAIEQGRLESSQEARTNADALAARLEALEQSLARQREQQWQLLADSNRHLLLLAASAIGLGLLALAFTALFQSRGMNRLADVATGLAHERALAPPPAFPALGQGESLLLGNGPASASGRDPAANTGRTLLATIEQLQQRIQELERTTHSKLPFPEPPPTSREPGEHH